MSGRGYPTNPPMVNRPGYGSHNYGGRPGAMGTDPRFPNGPQLPADDTFLEDFFIYNVLLGTFTSSASVNTTLQIQADSSFECLMSTCSGFLHGVTQPAQDNALLPISIQITDTGAGRSLFNTVVPIGMFAGTGKQPFILPISRIFQANSTIQISATNTDATDQWDAVNLAFIGRKIWKVRAN